VYIYIRKFGLFDGSHECTGNLFFRLRAPNYDIYTHCPIPAADSVGRRIFPLSSPANVVHYTITDIPIYIYIVALSLKPVVYIYDTKRSSDSGEGVIYYVVVNYFLFFFFTETKKLTLTPLNALRHNIHHPRSTWNRIKML